MSRFRRAAARLSLAGIAAVALSAAVALPASGHTGHLFTSLMPGEGTTQFGTIDPVTAVVSPLGTPTTSGHSGIEIVAETGYVIEVTGGEVRTFAISTWDHTTGAILGSVPIVLPVAGLINTVEGLDALPDGTLIAYLHADIEDGEFDVPEIWVVSINPATGMTTFLVELTALDDEDFYTDSLATDPTTGTTYAFVDYNDGIPLVVTLDLAGGTYSAPVALAALRTEFGDGYVAGADYDTAGTLWFFYSLFGEGDTAVLASASGTLDAVTEAETISSPLTQQVELQSLAYDPYVPQLAATGFPVLAAGAMGVALLGAGGLAMVARRRRAA
jgi:hypothetical protein